MKRVLVIRYKKSVGDTVIGSTLCESIQKYFSDDKVLVDFLVYEHLTKLFEEHKSIHQVLTLNRKEGLKGFWKLLRTIRKNKYDIVIDCRCIPQTTLLTFLSGAKIRIGKYRRYRSAFYTTMVRGFEQKMNQIEKYHLLLKPLGIQEITKEYHTPLLEGEKDIWRRRMEEAGVDFKKLVVAIVIAARQNYKQYPKDYSREILEQLLKKYNAQLIFLYAPSEKAELLDLYEDLGRNENIFVEFETKNTKELALLLSNCDIFLGNEGGSRHVAEFVGLPNLAIVSPGTDKEEWIANENEKNQCITVHDVGGKDYHDITVKYVLERFEKQLVYFQYFNKESVPQSEKNKISD